MAVAAALAALPRGAFTGRWRGARWQVRREVLAGGRAEKLVADELGGPGRVSLNLYRLGAGPELRPCEIPLRLAVDFACGLEPDQ